MRIVTRAVPTTGSGTATFLREPESIRQDVWRRAGERFALATVSRAGADGIAHVARLLHRALTELSGRPPLALDVDPASPEGVTIGERASFATRLVGAQAARRVDRVIFGHVTLARAQRRIPGAFRRPYAVFTHGVEVWGTPLSVDRLAALQGAELLLSNSHFTARRIASMYPALQRVHACPLALLPPPVAADAGKPDDALLSRIGSRSVLIVGRMIAAERYKGHDELIDCWRRVCAGVPGAQLVVAGAGDDAERLRGKASAAGLGDAAVFCGRVSDATLAALYERTAVFAMPSCGEGFGIVYLEAMRAGRPCIASSDDGAVDVVVAGETGLLIPHGDRDALATAVIELLSRPERAAALGQAGRRRYEQHFTFGHFRDRLRAALESVPGHSAGDSD